MPDGLGLLDQQRQRRARGIPAPRNPPRTSPVEVVELAPRQAEPPASEPPEAVRPEQGNRSEPAAKAELEEPPLKMSIYLEPTNDDFLETITHAGKTTRPKVAISRSAVVRLALERLSAEMTVGEIIKELAGRGSNHDGPGRKRR